MTVELAKWELEHSSVNRHFGTIRDFFSCAKKWGWIASNPCAELESLPESPEKRKPWPSDEWIQKAIDAAAPWAAPVFYFIAHTGVRPVGAKRLCWHDIDFTNRKFKIKSMKGDGTLREHWIPMTEDLYKFFHQLFISVKPKQNDLVFETPEGLSLDSKNLAREMRRVTTEIGLPGYTLYGFRHFVVTNMANPSRDGKYEGNLEAARILAGHASISQTQAYNHAGERIVREALNKVAKTRKIKFKGVKKGSANDGQKRTIRKRPSIDRIP